MDIAAISLLNQDRILLVCAISCVLMTIVFTRQTRRWYTTKLPYLVLGSTLIGTLVWTSLWHFYPEDGIPLLLILWVALIPFTVILLFIVKRTKFNLIATSIGTLSTLLLSFLLINQYFQYYPTLGSLFGADDTSTKNSPNGTLIRTSDHPAASIASVETSYQPPMNQPSVGSLESISIPGTTSHFSARQSFVYLPPAALTQNAPKLPVLILLSGVPGNPGDWIERVNMVATLNNVAAKHSGITPIVVVADQTGGDGLTSTGCVDSPRGNAETYLTTDVPAYIKSHYSVLSSSTNWGIGGISDGGACSTMLAIRHPSTFSVFMSLSGETSPSIESKQDAIASLFNGSSKAFNAYDTLLLLQSKNASSTYTHTSGWLSVGRDEQEPLVQDDQAFFNEAKADKMDTIYETLPGHHGFALWKQAFVDAIPWISHHLGATL